MQGLHDVLTQLTAELSFNLPQVTQSIQHQALAFFRELHALGATVLLPLALLALLARGGRRAASVGQQRHGPWIG